VQGKGNWDCPEVHSCLTSSYKFILGAEPLSAVPVWAEPSQLLIGMWPDAFSQWDQRADKLQKSQRADHAWPWQCSGCKLTRI